MKFSTPARVAAACATVALALTGCVVAPVGMEPGYGGPGYGGPPVYGGQGHAPPPAMVYVAPTYVMPGPGYAWQFHGRYGWGWHHPGRGWHRGWR
jgi:hypothetical protein